MHGRSFEWGSCFRVRAHMTPKKVSILLRKYRVKMALNSNGKTYESLSRMPQVIQELPVNLTTKDEELGTDHRHGMAVTTGTIDHDAGTTLATLEGKKV